MNDAATDALASVVRRFGYEVCDDPRRLEALLRDLASGYRREVAVLVAAARAGIPRALLEVSTAEIEVLMPTLSGRLEEEEGIAPGPAGWAVGAWAAVLGIDTSFNSRTVPVLSLTAEPSEVSATRIASVGRASRAPVRSGEPTRSPSWLLIPVAATVAMAALLAVVKLPPQAATGSISGSPRVATPSTAGSALAAPSTRAPGGAAGATRSPFRASAPVATLMGDLSARMGSAACVPVAPGAESDVADAALVAIRCSRLHVVLVIELLPDAAMAQTRYEVLQAQAGVSTGAVGCWNGQPGEVEYSYGRVSCAAGQSARVSWLDSRSNVVGTATGSAATPLASVVDVWWNQALYLDSGGGPLMSPEQQSLLELAGPSWSGTCKPNDPTADHAEDKSINDPVGDIAAIDCLSPTARLEDIAFFKFTSADALNAWYATRSTTIAAQSRVALNSGSCMAGGTGETAWTGGRAICYMRTIDGHAAIRWTDEPKLVYGVLNAQKGYTIKALTSWWTSNGMP